MNPLVKLDCHGHHCKTDYISESDGYNHTAWVNNTWLQANGNLTLEKLTHGLVNCETECADCDEAEKVGWNYTYMKLLDRKLNESGKALPTFLTTLFQCQDFCKDGCENGLIALPGNNTMNKKWTDMKCRTMETEFDARGKICPLVELYTWAYYVTIVCLAFMVLLQFTMLGLEYVNFDSFLDGRFRCLFCPYWVKKSLYITMAFICLLAQLYTFWKIYTDTDDRLDDYFSVIDGNFKYDWETRGFILFIIAIVGSLVTIITMFCFMTPVERQKKKSYRNDIHGISTESVLARKF